MRYSKLRKIEMRLEGKVHNLQGRYISGKTLRVVCISVFGGALCFLIVSIVLNFLPTQRLAILRLNLEDICKINVPPNNWEYIIIHHSATHRGNAEEFDRYHSKVRGWKYGLAYHFVIGNGNGSADGEIEVGDRWKKQIHGAHTANMSYNRKGIGICVVGNLEEEMMTPNQFDTLFQIVLYLSQRYEIPLSNIIMHSQVKQRKGTLCPGKNFPYKFLISRLSDAIPATPDVL